jgi:hypothetical protein
MAAEAVTSARLAVPPGLRFAVRRAGNREHGCPLAAAAKGAGQPDAGRGA